LITRYFLRASGSFVPAFRENHPVCREEEPPVHYDTEIRKVFEELTLLPVARELVDARRPARRRDRLAVELLEELPLRPSRAARSLSLQGQGGQGIHENDDWEPILERHGADYQKKRPRIGGLFKTCCWSDVVPSPRSPLNPKTGRQSLFENRIAGEAIAGSRQSNSS
jgi:hypothetical protein